MRDLQAIIDDVRAAVRAGSGRGTDHRELAEEFAAVCETAEWRLRRCEDLLRRGLRAEAIHQAELEPPLLDLLTQLDFPEREDWDRLAAMGAMPHAPPVNRERAVVLNRAYAEHAPLEKLLREHRELAFHKAHLTKRLLVLRRLADADPLSTVWPEEVERLEAARLTRIGESARKAIRESNFDKLDKLNVELNRTPWRVPIPSELLTLVGKPLAARDELVARESLAELVGAMEAAAEACEVEPLREMRSRWATTARRANLPSDDPFAVRAGRALAWLDQYEALEANEGRFREAAEELRLALKRPDAPLEELERLALEAESFGRKLPPAVNEEYRRRVDRDRVGRQRRGTLIMVALFVAGLIVTAGVVLAVAMR